MQLFKKQAYYLSICLLVALAGFAIQVVVIVASPFSRLQQLPPAQVRAHSG